MICFLTSRHDEPESFLVNPANGLRDRLRACLPSRCRALYVCSDPDGWEKTDFYARLTRASFEGAGICFRRFRVLDGRTAARAERLVREADFIIFAGGHVPTQNRFFTEIGLKDLLAGFGGVLLTISAGTMNCAQTVYAQPEEEGEALDPDYRRFLPGLGLTDKMILPHYQDVKDAELDGLRVMEDISYPDSMGRRFYLLPDGSYLLLKNGRETIFGEAWLLEDGVLTQISENGGRAALPKSGGKGAGGEKKD